MTPSIRNISSTSNVNVPGRWAFKMDQLHPEDIAGNIDNSTDVLLETTIAPIYRTSTPAPVLYSSDLLYPYGPLIDAVSPTSDDGGTPLIPLSTSLHLFGRNYSSLYVNNNGLLSFRSSISQFTPQQLPVALGNPFLAVFWADINNQVAGDIYYRQSTDPDLLHQVSSDIRTYFHDEDFTAQWVFVATWHRVAYFGSNTNKVDTFQAVVTTDGNQTFLFYNYADLQWPSMREDGSSYDGPLTLAGINSGYNTGYYTLPGSLSHDIRNVSSTSNVNVTGRWVFKVGNLHPEDINGALDNDAEVLTTETPPNPTAHPEIPTNPIYIQSRTTVAPSPVLRSSDLLYPYGTSVDTMSPKSDDGSSPLVGLSTDVPLFGRNRTSLYVDNNGLLSFRSAISQYVPQALPQAFGNPFLALFWSDINNQVAGDIFYRQSTDPDLLSRATSDIQAYFHNVTFTAHWVFVATWHRVAYYGSNTNKVNTFQAVLSTDGNQTFLLYNYADIQWPSVANGSIQEGRTALAGLNSGLNSGYYTIPGSMTPSIRNISSTSNVNVPGRWAFKMDQLHPEDIAGNIDNSTDVLLETTIAPIYITSTPAPALYSSDLLYPYGPLIDAVSPTSDDGGTPLIPLSTSLHLFGRNYSSLYVNNNGLLSFRSSVSQFTPQQLPVALGNPFLAVFWADINNQVAGDIYYRQSTDPDLLHQVSSDIRTYFHDEDFTAQWVFVATWHRVAYFGSNTNKVDTFQAVVTTDGNQTFLFYNYADLQWPSMREDGSRYDGPLTLAGINSGYNTGYYTLPGSLSHDIRNVSSTSNVNVTGRWVFKVGNLHPEDINGALGNDAEVLTTETPLSTTTHPEISTNPIYIQSRTTVAPSPVLRSSDLLYPYGTSVDTMSPKSDDGSSPLVGLSTDVPLFGRNRTSLYVDNNGLLSFRSAISQYVPQALPQAFGNPFLALFWSDINNQVAGDIFYRQSTDPDLLSRATSDIHAYFHNVTFTAHWAFVATWHRVAYYGSNTNKVNTFQAVLSTDSNQTFLLYNYADIQWPSVVNGSIQEGRTALAGLNSGFNSGYYTIPGSMTPSIRNISSTSNVNVPGRWAFKMDQLHPEDIAGNIDNSTDVLLETTIAPIYRTSTPAPVLYSSDLLYPYGPLIDAVSPTSDDGGTPLIPLSTSLHLFGRNYSSLYVNNNGLLSFRSSISQFTPQQLPVALGNPFLAVFWADINNQVAGDIYYRQSTDPDLLHQVSSDIRTYFHDEDFTAQWVFVATWHRVAYFGSNTNKVDTFQAVVTTDGNQTFLFYNYADLQWPSMREDGSSYDGPLTLAGINSGYNTGYYTLPGSLSHDIRNVSSTSNVNVTGRWVFKVGNLHPEDINGALDNDAEVLTTETPPNPTAHPEIPTNPIYIQSRTTVAPSPVLRSSDLLYPYGTSVDTMSPKSDDGSSPLVGLSTDVPLFGRNRTSLYVDNNGLLSFRSAISQYVPQALPQAFGNPFLALFWSDINNQVAGDIFYRQSTDPDLLSRATSDIQAYFHNVTFTAHWVFVATWHRVAYYGSNTNKVNTFQAVLSTDGNQTFLLYNYADIQWPSVANGSIQEGRTALAGLNSGLNSGYYTIPGSMTPSIRNISSTSNVNVPGRWAFKMDQLHPEDIAGNIDNSTDVLLETTIAPIYITSTPAPALYSSDLLYPYGPLIDAVSPTSDDGGTPLIPLSTSLHLFGRNYSSLYVNNNGLLSFRSSVSQFTPQQLPVALGNPFLAVFWADINNQVAGDIYYRQSTDPDLLHQVSSDIRTYFHDEDFTAQWVFVATWHRVAYFGSNTNKVDTFQAVVTTDGNQTFLFYNYADLQWPSMREDGSRYDGPLTLAGINSGYNTGYYTLPGSLSHDIRNVSSTSNVNVTGRWVFKVGNLHPEDINGALGNDAEVLTTETPLSTTTHPEISTDPIYIQSRTTVAPSPVLRSSDLLYPYGTSVDTMSPKSDDGSSPLVGLSTDVPLFGRNRTSLYVDNNGLLSFRSTISQYVPQALPQAFGNPFLALFWSDINNQVAGDIFYRQSTDPDLLSRATSDIHAYFHNVTFTAHWAFVATWHRVAYYGSNTNKVNTFQAVLSTDGNQTFLLYNYADIQWPSVANGSIQEGRTALAGLNSGFNSGYYTIPGSMTPSIRNISSTSNVNVPGRWAFKMDQLHPEDIAGNIDNSTDVLLETTIAPIYRTSTPAPVLYSSDLLYPYGPLIDAVSPTSDDGGTPLIPLSTSLHLFGRNYSSLYVNNNGLLSFRSSISQFTPQQLPVALGNPFLAVFWADINNQVAGDIYYRQSTDPDLLHQVSSDIRTYFHDEDFTAQWVFVATWHRVAYFGSNTNKVDTFQAVVTTDGNQTFLFYNYADLQWPSMREDGSRYDGPLTLAGINSGFNTGYYTLPGSLSHDIRNASST
ncbi:uncharacterized protein, partial [Hyperolius riggenbachi]|uniref:uncharacterized protein n=1 Tax=Hyperolius riggenbachi TaxID=752182 RepID=UPI0035A3853A